MTKKNLIATKWAALYKGEWGRTAVSSLLLAWMALVSMRTPLFTSHIYRNALQNPSFLGRLKPFRLYRLPINDVTSNVNIYFHMRYKIKEDNGHTEYILSWTLTQLIVQKASFLMFAQHCGSDRWAHIFPPKDCNELLHKNCTIICKSLTHWGRKSKYGDRIRQSYCVLSPELNSGQ